MPSPDGIEFVTHKGIEAYRYRHFLVYIRDGEYVDDIKYAETGISVNTGIYLSVLKAAGIRYILDKGTLVEDSS